MDSEIRNLERQLLAARVRMGDPPFVIVRSRDSGAWAGLLIGRGEPGQVSLDSARRLWHWAGAMTLSEIAIQGVESPAECKFACPVRVDLDGVCEIIYASPEARTILESVPPWRK